MKENELILEFVKNVYADNFADAETSLRSVIEEKIKCKMKEHMKAGDSEDKDSKPFGVANKKSKKNLKQEKK